MSQPTDPSFNDEPLESLLDTVVHDMTPEQLAAYVQRCAVLRSSAQTRKAALVKESVALGVKKKTPKKSSVDLALELLNQLKGKPNA